VSDRVTGTASCSHHALKEPTPMLVLALAALFVILIGMVFAAVSTARVAQVTGVYSDVEFPYRSYGV
jgi:energy-converting hydrogenase Eha subunit A